MRARKVSTTHPFGNLAAPRDSAEYAVAVLHQAQGSLNSHKGDVEGIELWVGELRKDSRYRNLDDEHGHPFQTWRQFCETRQPYGLGYSPEAISGIVADRRKAQELAADAKVEPLAGHGGTREQGENSTLPRGSTSASYIVKRLKRDHPEIAAGLARGEYRSARAAGIAAGIVKVPSLVEQALRLIARMTEAERSSLFTAYATLGPSGIRPRRAAAAAAEHEGDGNG